MNGMVQYNQRQEAEAGREDESVKSLWGAGIVIHRGGKIGFLYSEDVEALVSVISEWRKCNAESRRTAREMRKHAELMKRCKAGGKRAAEHAAAITELDALNKAANDGFHAAYDRQRGIEDRITEAYGRHYLDAAFRAAYTELNRG